MTVTRNTSRRTAAATFEMGAPAHVELHGRSSSERSARRRGKSAPMAQPPRSKRTVVLADVELKRIEDALLDSLLDTHANRDNALDRLLDDMARVESTERTATERTSTAGVRPFCDEALGESKVQRIEDLLVAAVMDNHPNRGRALDRIFDDLEAQEQHARANYDAGVDTDFDGLS